MLDVGTVLLNIRDCFLIALGFFQTLLMMLRRRPDVIFINGGSVGVPVGLAARLRRVPYVIHESDTVLGLANRLIAPSAQKIATAFDIDLGAKLATKTVRVGIPLGAGFNSSPDQTVIDNLVRGMNLDKSLPLVLAVGGSLGAARLNYWLLSQADDLLNSCQLVLLTGHKNYAAAQSFLADNPPALASRIHLMEFTDRMADLMRLADVVVTRAGATTLMEVAAVGRPAIIIPNDMLTGGHQTANARWFASAGMAETLSESSIEAEPAVLVRSILSLLNDEPRRRRLAESIRRAHMADASATLAGLILEEGRGKRSGSETT